MNATLETLERPVNWLRDQVNSLPCNVGRTEQKLRLIAGGALLTAAFAAPVSRGWRVAMGAFGAMELATGWSRFCPLWKALNFTTARGAEA